MATNTLPKFRPQSTRRNPTRMALDEQRLKLFDAHAIIETTVLALESQFGGWPSGVPDFRLALRSAARLVDEASGALEWMLIEKRAAELAAPAVRP